WLLREPLDRITMSSHHDSHIVRIPSAVVERINSKVQPIELHADRVAVHPVGNQLVVAHAASSRFHVPSRNCCHSEVDVRQYLPNFLPGTSPAAIRFRTFWTPKPMIRATSLSVRNILLLAV